MADSIDQEVAGNRKGWDWLARNLGYAKIEDTVIQNGYSSLPEMIVKEGFNTLGEYFSGKGSFERMDALRRNRCPECGHGFK